MRFFLASCDDVEYSEESMGLPSVDFQLRALRSVSEQLCALSNSSTPYLSMIVAVTVGFRASYNHGFFVFSRDLTQSITLEPCTQISITHQHVAPLPLNYIHQSDSSSSVSSLSLDCSNLAIPMTPV